jgi:hypothetical protein
MTLTPGRIESRILLKLAIGEPGRFSSNLYDLVRNANHLPEFVNPIVNSLYLNFDLRLQLVHDDFRRMYFAPRLSNFQIGRAHV